MTKFNEIVAALQHAMHISKPLIFEAVLFLWALVEMGRFVASVLFAEHGA